MACLREGTALPSNSKEPRHERKRRCDQRFHAKSRLTTKCGDEGTAPPSDDTYTRRDDVGSRRTRLTNANEAVGGVDLIRVKSCAEVKKFPNDKDEPNDNTYVEEMEKTSKVES
jgi:hypothetical protein